MPADVSAFFRRLVGEAVRFREATGAAPNDFLQLLLGLKDKAQAEGQAYGVEEVTAHSLTFFTDGFETSSVALSFLLHDLSGCPAAQRRLREELLAAPPGDLEAPLRLPFLHACLTESLRLHPPVGFLEKLCTRPYPLSCGQPPREALLPVGTHVLLPVAGWASDEALFPSPAAYRPQRYMSDDPPPNFFAFGDGPRQCIGMRFAQMQIKLGVAALVRNFEIRRTPRSPADPVREDPKQFLCAALGGLWLDFQPLAAAATG